MCCMREMRAEVCVFRYQTKPASSKPAGTHEFVANFVLNFEDGSAQTTQCTSLPALHLLLISSYLFSVRSKLVEMANPEHGRYPDVSDPILQ
jgi:hypothetical protein